MVEKVGERIRYFRQMKGLSQEKLALMSDLNPAFLEIVDTILTT